MSSLENVCIDFIVSLSITLASQKNEAGAMLG